MLLSAKYVKKKNIKLSNRYKNLILLLAVKIVKKLKLLIFKWPAAALCTKTLSILLLETSHECIIKQEREILQKFSDRDRCFHTFPIKFLGVKLISKGSRMSSKNAVGVFLYVSEKNAQKKTILLIVFVLHLVIFTMLSSVFIPKFVKSTKVGLTL